jgi:hypothetical protein
MGHAEETISSIVQTAKMKCPNDGIGRRARFKIVCRKTCRFEAYLGYMKGVTVLDAFDFVKTIVTEIRKRKTKYGITEVYVDINDCNLNIIIYYKLLIEKLTKTKIIIGAIV